MPTHEELKDFTENLIKKLKTLGIQYKILDEMTVSRVLVLGKNKKELKIKKSEI